MNKNEFDKFLKKKEELWEEFEKSLDEKTLFKVLKFALCFESLERYIQQQTFLSDLLMLRFEKETDLKNKIGELIEYYKND